MDAQYHLTDIYAGNPYVEALPPMLSGETLASALAVYPEYHETDRDKSAGSRLQLLSNLTTVYQPLPMTFELYSQIYLAMQKSYARYGSVEGVKDFIAGYKYLAHNEPFISTGGGNSFSLIGVSGLGKSTAIQHILALFPRIIQHTEYHGRPFLNVQIPYLVVQTPHDCSVKSMCLDILLQVDEIAGTHYYEHSQKSRISTDVLVAQIAQISRCLHIGVLILDEVQNLTYGKSALGIRFLNFLVQFVNASSLSICLVGTPQVYGLLKREFRAARRATGFVLDRLDNGEEFRLLVSGLWRYQYTKNVTPLTPQILQWLYRKSQGIPDIVVKLLYFSQHHAIMSGREILDLQALEHALEANLYILDDYVSHLENKKTRPSHHKSYGDIEIPQQTLRKTKGKSQKKPLLRSLYKKAKQQNIPCETLLDVYITDEVELC